MGTEAFKAARDFLFAHRTDYRAAHAGFRWPKLENFNYALDWFDGLLRARVQVASHECHGVGLLSESAVAQGEHSNSARPFSWHQ